MFGKVFILLVIISKWAWSQTSSEIDPTRPRQFFSGGLASTSPQAPTFTVGAIFYSTENPQALINQQLVSVGYEFDDAVVTSIAKNKVVLSRLSNGEWKPVTVFVNPASNSIKTRSADNY